MNRRYGKKSTRGEDSRTAGNPPAKTPQRNVPAAGIGLAPRLDRYFPLAEAVAYPGRPPKSRSSRPSGSVEWQAAPGEYELKKSDR